jgi:dipeptidyl aminopeptidase/acylaminoacyl peptidase
LFAALGYAVLLPSIPTNPDDPSALEPLMRGVIPAIDAAVASGIADPDRLAVVGHSGGGFAALGLIVQTNRFRSAIASAAYSNFLSFYGTFYGSYRYGDSGSPETAQILRMLNLENGFMGLGGDPWTVPERYRNNSAVLRADKVETSAPSFCDTLARATASSSVRTSSTSGVA